MIASLLGVAVTTGSGDGNSGVRLVVAVVDNVPMAVVVKAMTLAMAMAMVWTIVIVMVMVMTLAIIRVGGGARSGVWRMGCRGRCWQQQW